jgi:hypothetical protein
MDTQTKSAIRVVQNDANPRAGFNSDPVIAAIARLSEPAWIEGMMHVQRLRALASCEVVATHVDVAAWLVDLANIIEEMSV